MIVLGGGGHASVIAGALLECGREVLGYVAPEARGSGEALPGRWLGADEVIGSYGSSAVLLANGVGSAGRIGLRRRLFLSFKEKGYNFVSVVHPAAMVSPRNTAVGEGSQVLCGAILGEGAVVGENVVVNTGAVVEHGCRVGPHSHISTGAILCGECTIGEGVHVGAGSTIIQGITIGERAVVGAGATVLGDVEPHTLVAGVPAAALRRYAGDAPA